MGVPAVGGVVWIGEGGDADFDLVAEGAFEEEVAAAGVGADGDEVEGCVGG